MQYCRFAAHEGETLTEDGDPRRRLSVSFVDEEAKELRELKEQFPHLSYPEIIKRRREGTLDPWGEAVTALSQFADHVQAAPDIEPVEKRLHARLVNLIHRVHKNQFNPQVLLKALDEAEDRADWKNLRLGRATE